MTNIDKAVEDILDRISLYLEREKSGTKVDFNYKLYENQGISLKDLFYILQKLKKEDFIQNIVIYTHVDPLGDEQNDEWFDFADDAFEDMVKFFNEIGANSALIDNSFIITPSKNFSVLYKLRREKSQNTPWNYVKLPQETAWSDIKMQFFKNGRMINITLHNDSNFKHTADYRQMGFVDNRTHDPDKQWEMLLIMSRNHGRCAFTDGNDVRGGKYKKYRISCALRAYFPTIADPDPFYEYTREHGYQLKIDLFPSDEEENTRRATPNGSYLPDISRYRGYGDSISLDEALEKEDGQEDGDNNEYGNEDNGMGFR